MTVSRNQGTETRCKIHVSRFSYSFLENSEAEQKDMVYEIKCTNCEKVYVGETKQKISARIRQHKNTCKNTYFGAHTALSTHAQETSHKFDFDNVSCLEREGNDRKRKILEAIHITRRENTVNFKSDTENLSKVYNNLIKRFDVL